MYKMYVFEGREKRVVYLFPDLKQMFSEISCSIIYDSEV